MEKNGEKITNCRPGAGFPSVSVTGCRCDLMCGHCRGVHLKGMLCGDSASAISNIARRIKSEGGKGILLSGGCDLRGHVPLDVFRDSIAGISDMGLEINVHPGFLSSSEAESLVAAGVGRFSVDVHCDPDVISGVLHMSRTKDAYSCLIDTIRDAGGIPVPHLTVGFGMSDLRESAFLVREKGMTEAVLLSLVPSPGMSAYPSVSEDEAVSAAEMLADMGLDVTLGCMRDRRMRTLEMRCIGAGVRRIANMSQHAVVWAEGQGYEVESDPRCCCMGIGSDQRVLPL